MSIRLMQLVWEQDLSHSRKLLLLSLADQANDNGECYPGIASIARRCGCSDRTVFRSLTELENDGFLERHIMAGGRNLYTLNEERLRQMPLPQPRQNGTPDKMAGRTKCHATPDTVAVTPCQDGSPIEQPPANPNETPAARGHGDEWKLLMKRERDQVAVYMPIPTKLDLRTFSLFLDHRRGIRRELSGPEWMTMRALLEKLAAEGQDLNDSLTLAIGAGLARPVDPRTQRKPAPSANDDLSTADYSTSGTPASQLPAHLRPGADTDVAEPGLELVEDPD